MYILGMISSLTIATQQQSDTEIQILKASPTHWIDWKSLH